MDENTDTATTASDATDEGVSAAIGAPDDPSLRQGDETAEDGNHDDDVENPAAAAKGRENSKLRERLRTMAARLETLQRTEAERLAGKRLGRGADLWAGGIELESLLDENGDLSNELLDQAVAQVLAAHPHWRGHTAPPASTVTANDKIGGPDTRKTFEDAFRPRSS